MVITIRGYRGTGRSTICHIIQTALTDAGIQSEVVNPEPGDHDHVEKKIQILRDRQKTGDFGGVDIRMESWSDEPGVRHEEVVPDAAPPGGPPYAPLVALVDATDNRSLIFVDPGKVAVVAPPYLDTRDGVKTQPDLAEIRFGKDDYVKVHGSPYEVAVALHRRPVGLPDERAVSPVRAAK